MKYTEREIFAMLDDKMVLYEELKNIEVRDTDEAFVWLDEQDFAGKILVFQAQMDSTSGMVGFERIFKTKLRKSVVTKISAIISELSTTNFKLKLVYGYRTLETQTRLFEYFYIQLSKLYSGSELYEQIHKNIAIPEVSGHPTGGAIDVCLTDQHGIDLDYGTSIWSFGKQSYTFSPFVSRNAWNNRMFLRQLMLDQEFAPFDGEWWHYSFGDKEWAFFYKKPAALYKQIDLPA